VQECEKKGDRWYGIGNATGRREALSSIMGIIGIHPAVFVRVANTGLTGYGTWKSAEGVEKKGDRKQDLATRRK